MGSGDGGVCGEAGNGLKACGEWEQHLPCPVVCVLLSSKPPLLWGFLRHVHKGWMLEQVLRREGGRISAL